MCQPDWLLGHTFNNLSLTLKLIYHKPKSHLLKVSFSLLLAKWFSQWVCHIVCRVYSFHLHIFFKVVVNDVTTICACLLIRSQLLNKGYGAVSIIV